MSEITGPISEEYTKDGVKSYSPSEKERESSRFVHRQWQSSEDSKLQTIENAWLGMAYFTGRQWSRYNRVTRLLTEDNPPAWRVRMVLNYIMPTVETLAGKLVENRPGFICLPSSDDDDDVEAARQCEHLLEYLWHELGMQNKLHEAVKWMATTGTVFFKCWWDSNIGDDYITDDDVEHLIEYITKDLGVEEPEEPESKSKKKKKKKRDKRTAGLPVIDVLSVLEVGWDPGARDLDDSRWIIHANMMHIDEIRMRWPKKGQYVVSDTQYEVDHHSQNVLREFSNSSGTDQSTIDRILVLEYFEKPSARHPDGYYSIVAGDIVLEEDEALPYGKMPFFCARHVTVPGKLAGEGVVTSLIPAQKELNKSVSQRIENKNLHAQPKWRAEKGSVDRSAFTDEPGEIIFYNRTSARPPEPLPPPPLSPEHRMLEKEQIEHIQNISGVSDVTRGMAPSQTSGRAIGLLSDLDATKLGPTVRELETCIEKMCMQMLWMWRQYMPIEKTIQVVGKNNGLEVFRFHSQQIKNTNVRIMANSMLPKHPSYRREQVMQMYQVGILGDPSDPQTQMKARKMMEFGDMDPVYGDEDRDRRYAREENHMLANGKTPDVSPWEDHIVMIDEHLKFMKSVEYRLLPIDVQENFERHLAWHYHAESQQQQGQPWWSAHVKAGVPGMPPAEPAAPGGAAQQAEGAPEMGGPPGGGPPAGLVGGGSPEMNQAIGTRGPGVADYETGFESSPR
tara:strand:- start:2100 stop:4298 length:2199 start_codon:yes stop_codon:yes gene_type:complete